MEHLKILTTNRKAHHNYNLSDRYEAGLSLLGTEVKSAREGRINLKDSYVKIENGEALLINCHISPYTHGNIMNHEPLRVRKLLLHKTELKKLEKLTVQAGFTLIPLRAYLKNGKIKLEIALAKGKKRFDKREAKKKKEAQRDMNHALRQRRSHELS